MAKILIADDEKDLILLLQSRLELKGFEVDICFNGGDANEHVMANEYDLVLLDYFMPSLKGDEICENIRENDRTKKLPVIIMTGHTDREEEFFKSRGADAVLYKPIDNEELFEKIKALLNL